MKLFNNLFHKEKRYFTKLHNDAQQLIVTILLYDLIAPIFGIFINAFLWRKSEDVLLVAFSNVVIFSFISLGFYLNGLLLRRFSPAVPFTLSLVGIGAAVAVLMFVPQISYGIVFLFSTVNGILSGVYWANRNLLTLKTTTSDTRIYFSSIETAISTTTKVIVPLAIGWFITFGTRIHLYSPIQGYQMTVIVMLVVIVLIWIISSNIS